MYDSARREVVAFEPLRSGRVAMYNCGPTVYDWQHIGNLYSYVVADVVRRTFEYAGYDVRQVMNITDVGHTRGDVDEDEDKMEIAAKRERKDPQTLAAMYTDQFFADRRKLNIQDPQVVSKATEHIPQMIRLIETLIAKGHAYAASDGVYYDVSTFPGYGTRLNAELPEERQAGARIEVNPNKRHPYDFALWRAAKPGDLQQWDSPWGRGNPGWHIECSAMSMQYLGETFDIHSGGEDHLFPHHECEIAQSEGATGKPFVRYWMHVRFLQVEGRGMHKSIGNTYLVSDIEKRGVDPLAFRLMGLNSGYRKPLNFTWRGLDDEQRRLDRWRSAIAGAMQSSAPASAARGDAILDGFVAAVTDDFNTPRALAVAEDAIALLSSPEMSDRARGLGLLFEIDRVLGLGLRAWGESQVAIDDGAVAKLLDDRAAARAAGDYGRSDQLRDELRELGYLVKDTKEGQRWERVPVRTKKDG